MVGFEPEKGRMLLNLPFSPLNFPIISNIYLMKNDHYRFAVLSNELDFKIVRGRQIYKKHIFIYFNICYIFASVQMKACVFYVRPTSFCKMFR